ncbi:protein-(glutamine-N5) methyltransferase, release factor-specific [Nonlabens tegetincola]|uniref:peptide chain release factor N(5)-glutamine methyltransferase n=1 Tax=Nonlabens tegetincola TaxID=323273 RepID=UPI000A205C55|nr:peptide chain release factor N(5)-glutamine methyltransferase [Nonlabens tegetincola]ARN72589.1 protein-(glutamine-N5) methyltransferase, release factor-specific [Nonlabens tegetincola]
MNLQEVKNEFRIALSNNYPDFEIDSIFKICCEDLLDFSRSDILLKSQEPLTKNQEGTLITALEKLKQDIPVQYITGVAHFYGRQFKVTENTLIPRPETEELVQLIVNDLINESSLKIIDIGTGTGCIGISLKKELISSDVTLLDVSKEALSIAKQNATNLKAQVHFIEQSILTTTDLPDKFDVIVSNPPYVRNVEKQEIHNNVLLHEPHLALFVENENPLLFYRKILELALHGLTEKGRVYFEINQYLSNEMNELASSLGFDSKMIKDYNGNWRMMICWKK